MISVASLIYLIPRYIGSDKIIRHRLVIAGFALSIAVFALVAVLLSIFPMTFASAMTVVGISGMFAGLAKVGFSLEAGHYLVKKISQIRARLNKYSYRSENKAIRKANIVKSVLSVFREIVLTNILTIVFGGFILVGFFAAIKGGFLAALSLPALAVIAGGIMAFVLLLKYNPKWAVGVSSTVFVVGIAQAGYTQVEVRKVDEETKRFQAELRVTLEKIGKDWDLTEYNKAIDKALEEYRNRLPLDYSQDVKDQWTLKALLGVKADIRIIDRFQIKTQLRLLAEQRSELAKRLKEGTLDKKSAEGILRYLEQEERLLKVSESIADIEAKNTPDKKNEEKRVALEKERNEIVKKLQELAPVKRIAEL
ncbi:MAG: hypothetical protein Q8O41_09770, partial [Candidatus Methanoperedens sp.]|nr:hypothetical protein [Candidatus Methanoperedens sp.]